MSAINKTLVIYSGVLTAVVAAAFLTGAGKAVPRLTEFDEIDVKRINVREDDGTLRFVLTNTSHAPGIVMHGKERPHPSGRRTAGMLFYNDEGTENGGMTWGGEKRDGKVQSGGHLSFDQYEQDQVIQLTQSESDGRRWAAMVLNDRPSEPMDLDLAARISKMPEGPARDAELKRVISAGTFGRQRMWVGKAADRSAVVLMSDALARPRMRLKVTPEGAASIDFLDEEGKVHRSIGPDGK
jgi:hypothetical protein